MVFIKRKNGSVDEVPHYEVVTTEGNQDGSTLVKLRDGSEGRLLRELEAAAEREAEDKKVQEFNDWLKNKPNQFQELLKTWPPYGSKE